MSKGISYSAIKPGQTETAANAYDTPATVEQVKEHDRVFESLCPTAPVSTEN